ncbi:MAG: hypothetical protein Fur0022_49070 [Anaerolineales bacterium]
MYVPATGIPIPATGKAIPTTARLILAAAVSILGDARVILKRMGVSNQFLRIWDAEESGGTQMIMSFPMW